MVGGDGSLTLTTPYGGVSAADQIYAIVLNFEAASVDFLSAAVALLTPSDRVTAVFGRSGAVMSQAGDYAAAQVTFAPTGGIDATDVQGALGELDSEKAALAGAAFTGRVLLPDGAAGVPALAFAAAEDTGLYLASDPAHGVVLTAGSGGEALEGGNTIIQGGPGGLLSGNGGDALLVGGPTVDGDGGGVAITARDGATLTAVDRNGGAVAITAGNAVLSGNGGSIVLTPGSSPGGEAGRVQVDGPAAFAVSPTAPTPATADSSTKLATTAFVKAQDYITAGDAPVLSVAGKTGNVALVVGDVSGAAPLISPVLVGLPTAPTQTTSDNSTAIATTAFVKAQGYITTAEAPVLSVAGKTGNVTLVVADISGAAPLASPVLTGLPSAPTRATSDNSTAIATTAFVKAQGYISAAEAPVLSVAGKTGNVTLAVGDVAGAAPLASPVLTGLPSAPTRPASDNSTAIATTAFVKAQGYITAAEAPVLSVAGRTGAVMLSVADVAGAAPLASPSFTGAPVAPTPATGDSSTAVATTAFVKSQNYVTPAQLAAAGGITWSTRTANFTAAAGNGYFVDTSGGAITSLLPASPMIGDQVRLLDAASTFGTNNLVVGRNGQLIMGLNEDMTVSTTYASVQLIFAGATYGWRLI